MKQFAIALFALVLSVGITHAQAPTYTTSTLYTAPEGVQLGLLDIDKDGNIYFIDTRAVTISKLAPDGTVTLFAGGGATHNLLVPFILQGDSWPALEASLGIAVNVSTDKDGNVYTQIGKNSWKITQDGTITLFAGATSLSLANALMGADGPAVEAIIPQPGNQGGIDFDGNGIAYMRAGLTTPQVVSIDTMGILKLHAGTGERGNTGDGGPALSAQLSGGGDIVVDEAGNVYLAEGDNGIRKISTDGTITTIVGNPDASTSVSKNDVVDGIDPLSARFSDILYLAVGPDGSIFFAASASDVVHQLTPDGKVTTIAGTGEAGSGGDGGPARQASFNAIKGLTTDASGNVYLTDLFNRSIRKLTRDTPLTSGGGNTGGQTGGGDTGSGDTGTPTGGDMGSTTAFVPGGGIATFAGSGPNDAGGFTGDGGPATDAQINRPFGIFATSDGNVYFSDTSNNRVRLIDATTGNISTIAGNGSDTFSGDGGPATDAGIPFPGGLYVDSAGNIYVPTANRVVKIDASGMLTTVAGNGTAEFAGDGGPATDASLNSPSGVVLDGSGNIFICDTQNHRVRRVDAATGVMTTFAGNGMLNDTGFAGTFAGDGGPATDASFNRPADIALDSSGNLYIMDRENNRLRKVDAASGNISTIAGNGEFAFSGDGGPATSAALASPFGVHVNGAGQIFVIDTQNQRVRMIDSDGNISSVAGSGDGGFQAAGFDGESNASALSAQLNFPIDVATDGAGNLYIADSANHRIRKVSPGDGTSSGGNDSGSGGDSSGGSTVELPTGTRGPVALDLDTAAGDQMVLQSTTNPSAGDNVVIDVVGISGASGNTGFQVVLAYDATQLEWVSFVAQDIFATAAVLPVAVSNGTATVSAAVLGGTASGDAGSIGHATFKVLDGFSDQTKVTLQSASYDAAVEIGSGGAFVVIGGVSSAFPTEPLARTDFDGDNKIGFGDFLAFAGAFGKKLGEDGYDARIDLDDNGEIGFSDFLSFASVFGQDVPQ